jgi:hypothetical protein
MMPAALFGLRRGSVLYRSPVQRCIVSVKFSNAPGPGEYSKPQGSARQLLHVYYEP